MNENHHLLIDKNFLNLRIKYLGKLLTEKYRNKNPVFLVVLKGAFIFASDLIRSCNMALEVYFIQLSSYKGEHSTGKVSIELALPVTLKDRSVIIVEDIIETGTTINHLNKILEEKNCASIEIVSALFKIKTGVQLPKISILSAFVIPPSFVLGYGLDYNQKGRNLPAVYVHKSN